MYKFEVVENWPGNTHYFVSLEEYTCGLRINENDNRIKDKLIEWAKKELQKREIICM